MRYHQTQHGDIQVFPRDGIWSCGQLFPVSSVPLLLSPCWNPHHCQYHLLPHYRNKSVLPLEKYDKCEFKVIIFSFYKYLCVISNCVIAQQVMGLETSSELCSSYSSSWEFPGYATSCQRGWSLIWEDLTTPSQLDSVWILLILLR